MQYMGQLMYKYRFIPFPVIIDRDIIIGIFQVYDDLIEGKTRCVTLDIINIVCKNEMYPGIRLPVKLFCSQ